MSVRIVACHLDKELVFSPYNPGATPRRTIPKREWVKHQATITSLYMTEDRTLKDVVAIMAREHAFVAE
jgi:hypothetical protein